MGFCSQGGESDFGSAPLSPALKIIWVSSASGHTKFYKDIKAKCSYIVYVV